MADKVRVRLFIDFWNFQLGWNRFHNKPEPVKIPWEETLPDVLVREAVEDSAKFAGAHVYASIDPNSPNDKKLKGWLTHGLASFTGYTVLVKDRKPRNPPKCPDCGEQISDCPKCGKRMRRTVEKGIDSSIITDLLAGAFDETYDVAVLISGDADFAPAVEYTQKKTDKQVVQAFFKDRGDELRNACWSHVFLEDLMTKLVSPDSP